MISDTRGQHLHDRATRGQHLSSQEQTELAAWYAMHNEAEQKILETHAMPFDNASLLVRELSQQLADVTASIHRLEQENKQLRQEISHLHTLLSQSSLLQTS